MSSPARRTYASKLRAKAAAATRARVLSAAKALFSRSGIDAVTIQDIAERAAVSVSTVYALFRSKEGVMRALVEGVMFGPEYQAARARLDGEGDPVDQLRSTAAVARAIYEREAVELGLLRGSVAFSRALRKLERSLEKQRFALQEGRMNRLYAAKKSKPALPLARARVLLWMYTSRDVYRLLVEEGGFTPDEYEAWLGETLVETLTAHPIQRAVGARRAAQRTR